MVMTLAVLLARRHVGIETIDWDRPPAWAQSWDANALVFYPADDEPTPSCVSEGYEVQSG